MSESKRNSRRISRKDSKQMKKEESTADDDSDSDDGVQLLNHSFFFKCVNPNLPIQTHESTPTSLPPATISLVRTCVKLCQCTYMKPKKTVWPEEVGPAVFYKRESDVTRIPFFICNSNELNTIFLACRGTKCFDDIVTDLMGNCVEVCGGLMHQGVYDTASYVFYNSQRILVQLSKENNNRPIVFTGHSLGGAVAACLCELVKQSLPEIKCRSIVFAPPPTVDLSLWQATRESTLSFIFEGDCIPFLSLENVINISVEILPTKVAKVVNNWVHKRLKQTANGAYDPSIQVQLCPPGELYLFVLDDKNQTELRKIGPEYFDRLTRGLADTKHAMINYANLTENYFRNHT